MSHTKAQLEDGARAIAYRVEQLAGVGMFVGGNSRLRGGWRESLTVHNAVVESGLANARALAEFLMDNKAYVHRSMFGAALWSDDVLTIAGRIYGEVSKHLGHATICAPEGAVHPGRWPLPEIALALVGGIERLHESLDAEHAAMFTPSPRQAWLELSVASAHFHFTDLSENDGVAALTKAVTEHLTRLGVVASS